MGADPLSRLLDAAKETATSFLPRSPLDLTPVPALAAGKAAITGDVQGRGRLVAGVGALLGLGGLGALGYHRWQAGELAFGEEGMLALPAVERLQGHPFRTSEVRPEYRPLDLRSQVILNSRDYEHLAGLLAPQPDATTWARTGGFLQAVGQDLAAGPAHAPHMGRYVTPEAGAFAASKWELAKLDGLHRQGALDGSGAAGLKDAYEALLRRPHELFNEDGTASPKAKTLRDFIGALSSSTQDVEDATLRLPPDRAWRAVEMGPDGPRFAVTHREQALPVRASKDTVLQRMNRLDYEAAVPEMVTNLLRNKGLLTTPTEVAKGMRWYSDAHALAEELVAAAKARGKDITVDQAAGIVSAFSPQLKWEVNEDVARRFVESGGTITSHPMGVLTQSFANARRIWDGEPVVSVLRSEKTSNFARNIADPTLAEPVTIDRHSIEAALGFRTFTDGGVIFDATPSGRRAYQAVAEAHRIAAQVEGLTANQVQAITWLPVQAFKGRGVRSGFEIRSSLRKTLLGQGEDGVAAVAGRAQGDDVGAVAHLQPPPSRSGPRPAFVEVLEPGGTSTVVGQGASTLLSEAFRTLRPLYRPPEGDLGWVRWVPVEARPVADADAAVRATVEQLVDRRAPASGALELHPTPDHPAMVAGNQVVVQAPAERAGDLKGFQALLTHQGIKAEVRPMAAHDRYLPELKAQRIGPDDVGTWSRSKVADELAGRQWVGISGWRSGASAEENAAANDALRASLERKGYRPIEVDGYYDGHEKSFIVFGLSNTEAIELGRQFKQESVVSPLGLVYTTGKNRGMYHPSTGDISTPGPRVDNYFSEMQVKGGTRRFQLGLDFDRLEPVPADIDAALRPAARPHQGLVVDLGKASDPDLLDEVWRLAQEQGLYSTAYVHGDVAPAGSGRVAEHHLTDSAGREVVYRSLHRNLDDPNAVWAHVPAEDAASFSAEPLAVIHGATKHVGTEAGGRFGDGLYDGELRLLYNHLGPDVAISTKNPLLAKAGGRAQRNFALWVPAGDLPVLAYGNEAVDQLAARFGADPGRVVLARVRSGEVELRAPAAPGDPSRVNEVILHRARQVLERAGVGGMRLVQDRPWSAAPPTVGRPA